MELIIFEKYLVRTYEHGFILQKVSDGKQALVGKKEVDTKSGTKLVSDYSNFGRETYPNTFEQVLKSIKYSEIHDADIKTLRGLQSKLTQIDNSIKTLIDELGMGGK